VSLIRRRNALGQSSGRGTIWAPPPSSPTLFQKGRRKTAPTAPFARPKSQHFLSVFRNRAMLDFRNQRREPRRRGCGHGCQDGAPTGCDRGSMLTQRPCSKSASCPGCVWARPMLRREDRQRCGAAAKGRCGVGSRAASARPGRGRAGRRCRAGHHGRPPGDNAQPQRSRGARSSPKGRGGLINSFILPANPLKRLDSGME